LPGNPAALSTFLVNSGELRPVALRPTLSDGLPFSSFTIHKEQIVTGLYSNTNASAK
jgi:hypothetical protein